MDPITTLDPITTFVGASTFVLILSAGSTLILSAWLLWLYRRATLRGMARAATPGAGGPIAPIITRDTSRATRAVRAPLRFREIAEEGSTNDAASARSVLETIGRSQRRAAAVHLSAGTAYALTMATTAMVLAGEGPSLGRAAMLVCIYLWPTVIALSMTSVVGTKERLFLFGSYAALLSAVSVLVLYRNAELTVGALLLLWAIINLPATAFFVLTLQDRIRSVGPLVFAFVLCGTSGAVLLGLEILTDEANLGLLVGMGQPFGLGATSLFVLVHLAGFVAAAVAGRYLLHRIGRAYRRKRCSDRSVTLDAMWLTFAVVQSIGFAFEGLAWALAGPVAFVVQRLVVALGFRLVTSRDAREESPPELLLLRVFSLGRRSNRFFETFSRLWRRAGVVDMIAGPDLVTASVEPHEFLEFAGGGMSRRFVVDADDLDRRLHALDRKPDPDARYRVHEFFCHDDTWRMTVRRLAADSDAVLMDLRSFTESNQGCLYELGVLLENVELRRIVFMVDETTDRAFLERSFTRLWSELDERSVNLAETEPTVRFHASGHDDRRAIVALIASLLRHVPASRAS